jgi:hypothetical protein
MTGLIILATSSAFSPKITDLPENYRYAELGLLPEKMPETNQFLSQVTETRDSEIMSNSSSAVLAAELIPDTTVKSESGKITMEFDENHNLISVSKNGKPLQGDERKEYEEMVAKMKKLSEQEKQQEEQKAAIEQAEKEYQAAQEQINKARQEYEKAVEAYAKSYTFEADSSETNVFVWTDRSGKSPKAVHEIRIERHPDCPEIPETYAFSFSDEDLPETYEELISAKEFEIQLNKLENDLKIIEIEKDIAEINAPKKIIVKTSGSDDLVPTLREELVKDGLLKNEEEGISFSLSEDELEVNGKQLSEDLHKKYLKIYKQSTGNKLEGKFKIVIKD